MLNLEKLQAGQFLLVYFAEDSLSFPQSLHDLAQQYPAQIQVIHAGGNWEANSQPWWNSDWEVYRIKSKFSNLVFIDAQRRITPVLNIADPIASLPSAAVVGDRDIRDSFFKDVAHHLSIPVRDYAKKQVAALGKDGLFAFPYLLLQILSNTSSADESAVMALEKIGVSRRDLEGYLAKFMESYPNRAFIYRHSLGYLRRGDVNFLRSRLLPILQNPATDDGQMLDTLEIFRGYMEEEQDLAWSDVLSLLESPHDFVRSAVLRMILEKAPELIDENILPQILEAVRRPLKPTYIIDIIDIIEVLALYPAGTPGVEETLVKLSKHSDPQVRTDAMIALAGMGKAELAPEPLWDQQYSKALAQLALHSQEAKDFLLKKALNPNLHLHDQLLLISIFSKIALNMPLHLDILYRIALEQGQEFKLRVRAMELLSVFKTQDILDVKSFDPHEFASLFESSQLVPVSLSSQISYEARFKLLQVVYASDAPLFPFNLDVNFTSFEEGMPHLYEFVRVYYEKKPQEIEALLQAFFEKKSDFFSPLSSLTLEEAIEYLWSLPQAETRLGFLAPKLYDIVQKQTGKRRLKAIEYLGALGEVAGPYLTRLLVYNPDSNEVDLIQYFLHTIKKHA